MRVGAGLCSARWHRSFQPKLPRAPVTAMPFWVFGFMVLRVRNLEV